MRRYFTAALAPLSVAAFMGLLPAFAIGGGLEWLVESPLKGEFPDRLAWLIVAAVDLLCVVIAAAITIEDEAEREHDRGYRRGYEASARGEEPSVPW